MKRINIFLILVFAIIYSGAQTQNINVGNDTIICGNSLQLNGIVSDTNNYFYWTSDNPVISYSPDSLVLNPVVSINMQNSSEEVYFILCEDSASSIIKDSVKVNFFKEPQPFAGIDDTSCNNWDPYNFTLNGTPSIDSSIVSWTCISKPQGAVVNFSDPNSISTDVNVTNIGDYQFRLEEKHVNNPSCFGVDSVNFCVIYIPIACCGNCGCDTSVCSNWVSLSCDTVGYNNFSGFWHENGAGFADYPDTNAIDTAFMTDPNVWAYNSNLNDTMIFVWETSNSACTRRDTVVVYFADSIEAVHLVQDSISCGHSFTGLDAVPPAYGTGFWIDEIPLTVFYNNGVMNSQVTNPDSAVVNQSGMHYFHWVVHNGSCIDTSEAIGVNFAFNYLQSDKYICRGESLDIISEDANSYLWNTGDTSQLINVSPDSSTSYTLTVTDLNICEISENIVVNVGASPNSEFTYSALTNFKYEFINNSTNATSYFWDFGDGTNSTNTSPIHIFPYSGNYTVMLKAENMFCDSASYEVIEVNSVEENDLNNNLKIYPNPNSGKFFISYESNKNEDLFFEITDISGKNILKKKFNKSVGECLVQLDTKLEPGIYLIKTTSESGTNISKFVVE